MPSRVLNAPRYSTLLRLLVVALIGVTFAPSIRAYSVLTHEAIVDALWDVRIKPMLVARYPRTTPAELQAAHAYAYGGAIIQDMGYYPFGNKLFSDLTHYVRSGDFVTNLIADSQNVNDFAFALGALSHYVADDNGHPLATNRAVPLLYPKLHDKFGDIVTYEDDPIAHVQTEFGFDVLEVAKGHFAPAAYHDFIGFNIAKTPLLNAFRETYGLDISDIIDDLDLALGSFRNAISRTIPLATKVAWAQRKNEIQRSIPGITRRRYRYNVSRSSYRREWGSRYERPGIGARILAFLLRIVPKIGPLRALRFHMPTPEVEQLFMQSFNVSVHKLQLQLPAASTADLSLPDTNFDTGDLIEPATYVLADKTYAALTERLARKNFAGLNPTIKAKILSYYKDPGLSYATKKHKKDWQRLVVQLQHLATAPVAKQPVSSLNHASH